MAKMKIEEKITYNYLENYFLSKPLYEPDGNIPPDFLINNIAIEVRRLNENRIIHNGFQGTEQLRKKILRLINKIANKIRYNGNQGYFISYTIRDTDLKLLENQLRNKLKDIYYCMPNTESFCLCDIKFNIRPSKNIKKSFTVGGFIDRDVGGFETNIYVRNINLCINEKVNKIKINAIKNYEHWWIIFVDYIDLSPLSETAITEMQKIDKQRFDTMIILNKDGKKIIEI